MVWGLSGAGDLSQNIDLNFNDNIIAKELLNPHMTAMFNWVYLRTH